MSLNREIVRRSRPKLVSAEVKRWLAGDVDERDIAFATSVLLRRSGRLYWAIGVAWTALTIVVAIFAVAWTTDDRPLALGMVGGVFVLAIVVFVAMSAGQNVDSLIDDIADRATRITALPSSPPRVIAQVGRWRLIRSEA